MLDNPPIPFKTLQVSVIKNDTSKENALPFIIHMADEVESLEEQDDVKNDAANDKANESATKISAQKSLTKRKKNDSNWVAASLAAAF